MTSRWSVGSAPTSMSMYQPSVYSPFSYSYSARSGSCERLLPIKKPKPSNTHLRYSGPRGSAGQLQSRQRKRMASNGVPIEQKKSYGIGGAGNIRRPSEVIYPSRTSSDGTRRQSSVWSNLTNVSPGSSPDGKRTTLLNLFSRKGSVSDAPPTAEEVSRNVDERVGFREVDLGKKD